MKQIRAIIADDEEALRASLKKKLSALWPALHVVGEARDGEAALRLVHDTQPDIAFLDIQMPALSGLEVAREIAGKALVVFITAHDKYAIQAFESEAIDYLLKPISDERLEKTIKRLKEHLSLSTVPDITAALEKVSLSLRKSSPYLQWIKALHHENVRLIPVGDVYYFKASDKYTGVRTREGEFLIRMTIKELEEKLDPDQFWRVHRAAIVNARAVHTVQRSFAGTYAIRFRDIEDQVAVSRAYAHLFKQI
jgi:DNA-binding LytR/AlgR family response regulator